MKIERFTGAPDRADVVIANGMAFFSGIVAREGCETMGEQTRDILAQYDALFAKTGIRRENLLMANTFLSNMEEGDEYGEVWREWIGEKTPPAGICVEAKIKDGKKIIIALIAVAD